MANAPLAKLPPNSLGPRMVRPAPLDIITVVEDGIHITVFIDRVKLVLSTLHITDITDDDSNKQNESSSRNESQADGNNARIIK